MPRPAIPKPGFSLLRLHSSKKPHNIVNLSSQARTDLVNSIAQDIEGCIWAVGYYVKMGVLNSTHTLGFDQVISDIRGGDDRRENEKIISWASNQIERYKKRAKAEKRRAKKLAARLRDRKSTDYDSSSSYPEMSPMKSCFAVTLDEQSYGKPPPALNQNVTAEQELSKSDTSEELERQPMTSLPILQPPHCSTDIDTSIEPVSAAIEDDRTA